MAYAFVATNTPCGRVPRSPVSGGQCTRGPEVTPAGVGAVGEL